MLTKEVTVGGAKQALKVRLYLGLVASGRERLSVTEDDLIVRLLDHIFIRSGVAKIHQGFI